MVFFTPTWRNAPPSRLRIGVALLLGCLACQTVDAKGFFIRSVETRLQESVYMLNANIQYDLSDEAGKALQNGVPLIILMEINVEKTRRWWWDKTIARLSQGYLLLYHALSEKYILTNLNSGGQTDYHSLRAALNSLGQLKMLPLIDSHLLESDSQYQVELRVRLDIDSLPPPMRPLAYISSDWQLVSDWYRWPLQP